MEYDEQGGVTHFVSGLVLGIVIGAGVALLSAPQSGRRTRRRIRRAAVDVRDQAGDRWDDVAGEVRDVVEKAIGTARKRVGR